MAIEIHKLDFDPSAPGDNQRVGAFLLGDSGTVITDTSGALDVNISAATGLAIFAEDSAAASGHDGQSVLLVRQDSLASSTSADGDYGNFKSNSKGELYIHDVDSVALLTTIDADTSSIATDASSIVTNTGSILTDTNALVVDVAAIEVLLTQIDADTSSIATDASTIAGDTTSIDAILTALSKAEDAVHGSGDQGIMSLAVRSNTLAALAGTDGDYAPLQVDANGALYVSATVAGSVADDDADAGNPIKIGSRAVSTATALGSISAANDRADLLSDLRRQLFTRDSHDVGWQVSTATVGTSEVELASSPLVGRKTVIIQNLGAKEIFIRSVTGVSVANGIQIPKYASMEFKFGEALNIFAISSAAGNDIRVIEAA